jgi:hypothetical protein
MYDVAIGGGIAGMATAARLQARRLPTIAFEAHSQPGGCVFFRHPGVRQKAIVCAPRKAINRSYPAGLSAGPPWFRRA